MSLTGSLVLVLKDPYGDPVTAPVDIRLSLQNRQIASGHRLVSASGSFSFRSITFSPGDVLELQVDARPRYLPFGRFLRLRPSATTQKSFPVALNPDTVKGIQAPSFQNLPADLQRALDDSRPLGGGASRYGALDDLSKAGLLNLFGKMERIFLATRRTVSSYFLSLADIRQDRVFGQVDETLWDLVESSVDFHPVSSALHPPPPGYAHAGSFKSGDAFGNLQLTFFLDGAGRYRVDADIDDANGLLHVFQVLRNAFTGEPTHPYVIHQILIFHQALPPLYRLLA